MDRDNLIYDMYRRRIESGYGGIPGPRTGGKFVTGDGMFSDVARDIAKKVATIALDDREGLDRLLRGLKGGELVGEGANVYTDFIKAYKAKHPKAKLTPAKMSALWKKHTSKRKPRKMNSGLKNYQDYIRKMIAQGHSLKDARCMYYDHVGKAPTNRSTAEFCQKTAERRYKPKKEMNAGLKYYQEFIKEQMANGASLKDARCMYYEHTGKKPSRSTGEYCAKTAARRNKPKKQDFDIDEFMSQAEADKLRRLAALEGSRDKVKSTIGKMQDDFMAKALRDNIRRKNALSKAASSVRLSKGEYSYL